MAVIKVRAGAKRHMPNMTRNWLVTDSWAEVRYMAGAERLAHVTRIFTCPSHRNAVAIADAIATGGQPNANLAIAMSEFARPIPSSGVPF